MSTNDIQLSDALGYETSDKRIDILRRIGEVGSISEAARGAGMSYKGAWQAIEALSNLAGAPLVEKVVGGVGGGGAQLTSTGQRLLRAAQLMHAARKSVLSGLDAEGNPVPGIAGLGFVTSMRNQFPCTVDSVSEHGASVRVGLLLASGAAIYSRITRESAELLGLKPGATVLALFKATGVKVAAKIPARDGYNLLLGQVSQVAAFADDREIGMALSPELRLTGFAEHGAQLAEGDAAMASIEESGVVIAISG